MKRVSQLLPADLAQIAVWRYEGSTDADAVVHATERAELSESDDGVFLARTQFVLGDGSQQIGFCTAAGDNDVESLQPVIVTPDGLVYFWFSEPPSEETLLLQWSRLGVPPESVFPVHYRCAVPVDGRYVTGVITAEDLTGAA